MGFSNILSIRYDLYPTAEGHPSGPSSDGLLVTTIVYI